jgi:two-component system, chemotaxis family, protein-glutamate methylesterase/glutaminase
MNIAANNPPPIKVLIADDSAFIRTTLTRMIESDTGLCVVGTAENGMEALEKISDLDPDVVTLDVEMPGLNGLETLQHIVRDLPRPVIMVSSLTQEGAEVTFEALAMGAFDYLPKPHALNSTDIPKLRGDLIAKIKAAAENRFNHSSVREKKPSSSSPAPLLAFSSVGLIALATSTGGPKALQEILPTLPRDLPVGILIVQHMPPGFTAPFARRLDKLCELEVCEAEHNGTIEPGVVYIAPAGRHMTVQRKSFSRAVTCLSDSPGQSLHIPSADVMMASVANTFKSSSMGIIMTGMGSDGAVGMAAIHQAGGFTIGQDKASCAVYGMPRCCAEAGALDLVVPLAEIPGQILQVIQYKKRA